MLLMLDVVIWLADLGVDAHLAAVDRVGAGGRLECSGIAAERGAQNEKSQNTH